MTGCTGAPAASADSVRGFQTSPFKSGLNLAGLQSELQAMPTPIFTIRLPKPTQDQLAEIAGVVGASSPRAFAREILETVLSGDPARINAFNVRLIEGVTRQFQLPGVQVVAAAVVPKAKPKKRRPKRGRG